MNSQNNGNVLHTELPDSVAGVPDSHDRPDAPQAGSPVIETQTWATRADALKTATAGNKKPIFLLGGGLAAAVALFAITTFVGKAPYKKVALSSANSAQRAATPKPSGSVTPLMDTVRNPIQSNTSGQLIPADIKRTKANAEAQRTPTSTQPASHPSSTGATLASVPTFESTQQRWEEPKPYGGTQAQLPVTGSQNLLKEASLVFVKKPEQPNASTAAGGRNDTDLAPELNLAPGTRIQARLETQASSAVTTPVVAVVEYTYSLGDRLVIPAGARFIGHLLHVDRSGYVDVAFDELDLNDDNKERVHAIGLDLNLGPIKGVVSGKNTGRNFLVRTGSGISSVAAMLVGNKTSTSFSENDLIRERIAQNIGNAGDTEIMNMAVTNRVVISVPADTPIYVVFTKRESGTSSPRSTNDAAQQ